MIYQYLALLLIKPSKLYYIRVSLINYIIFIGYVALKKYDILNCFATFLVSKVLSAALPPFRSGRLTQGQSRSLKKMLTKFVPVARTLNAAASKL